MFSMEILLYIVLGILLLYLIFKPSSLKGKVIPGPGGLPFVGSAFDISTANFHIQLYEYAKKYGDIVGLNLFGQNMVALNSEELIRKAFCDDPYKKYFNDREETFVGKYVLFENQTVAAYTNGFDNTHNKLRKGLVRSIHAYGEGIEDFETNVMSEIERLMMNIDNLNGEEFEFTEKIKTLLSNIVAILLSGETLSDEDEEVNLFWEYNRNANYVLSPKRNSILMTFPFLRHLPGAYREPYMELVEKRDKIARRYFQKIKVCKEYIILSVWKTKKLEPTLSDYYVFPFRRDKIARRNFQKIKETHTPNKIRGIIDFLIDEQAQDVQSGREVLFNDTRIIGVALDTVAAGILTSWSTISSLLLCLLNHPEYQTKIQQELDHVIGRCRLPALGDRENCPFFEAVALEVLRYNPAAPLSVPHICRSNVAFEGYDVKKNTYIFPNIHFLHHNDKIWGDPWTFRPERFLDKQGQILPRSHPFRKNLLPFGVGRRQCIGETLARSRIFLIVTTLLQRWNLVPSPGKCGSCDPRSDQFKVEFLCLPKPFYCKVVKRKK